MVKLDFCNNYSSTVSKTCLDKYNEENLQKNNESDCEH